jgi:hypothetical protein
MGPVETTNSILSLLEPAGYLQTDERGFISHILLINILANEMKSFHWLIQNMRPMRCSYWHVQQHLKRFFVRLANQQVSRMPLEKNVVHVYSIIFAVC